MAPRDLKSGSEFPPQVLEAVAGSRLLIALLNERISNAPQLATEIKNAGTRGIPVVAVRLVPRLPAGDLTSVINRYVTRWVDASSMLPGERADQIASTVEAFLGEQGWPAGQDSNQTATVRPGVRNSSPVAGLPPQPYEGKEPYIFISYKRADSERVYPCLSYLTEAGFRFWYDKGIPGGAEWDALIESKVRGCQFVLVFLSNAAVESKHVRREVKFGDKLDKPVLAVQFESVEFQHGLEMLLSQYQILDSRTPDFPEQLKKAAALLGKL